MDLFGSIGRLGVDADREADRRDEGPGKSDQVDLPEGVELTFTSPSVLP